MLHLRAAAALWRTAICHRLCTAYLQPAACKACYTSCTPLLARPAAAMPKIPATSKRARVVLSSESQLPPGVTTGAKRLSGGASPASHDIPHARTRGQRKRKAAAMMMAASISAPTIVEAVEVQARTKPKGEAGGSSKSAGRVAIAKASKAAEPNTGQDPGGGKKAVAKPKRRALKKEALTGTASMPNGSSDAVAGSAEQPKGRKKGKKAEVLVPKAEDSGAENPEDFAAVNGLAADGLVEEADKDLKPTSRRRVADPSKVQAAKLLKLEQRALAKAEKEKAFLEMQPEFLDNAVARLCGELNNDSLGATAPWELEDGLVGGARKWVGCHVSMSGGMERAVINAAACGCRAFAIDTQSKLRWINPPLEESTVQAFRAACTAFGFSPSQILPHGSYLINLASPDPEMAKKGYDGFLRELIRCERLGLKLYNFHPGSTTGLCTHEESMDRIAGFINDAHAETKDVIVVLESMAGRGNTVGGKFEHLRYIIDRVHDKARIGVCLDTCHMFSAGLDLRTPEACEATFANFDAIVGSQYLKALHVNDSKTDFSSGRDRHQNIGRGSIPLETFRWIMRSPRFDGMPLIMETPVEEREPAVDYKRSLQHGRIVWRDPSGEHGVGTDRRDIMLLNSFAT